MIESAGAVAGTYLPVQCPVKRCLPLQGGFALDIDPGLGREPLLFQPCAAGLNQALVKGRVKKDQREASLVRRTGGKESLGIGHLDPGPWSGAQSVEVGFQTLCYLTLALNEQRFRGSPRERFEAQGTGASKQVEYAGARRHWSQPVEQGLAYAVWRRAQAGAIEDR